MNQIKKEQNSYGSIWRKWDLHFHTKSSHDYKDNSVSDEELIEILVAKNIAVVAITDHHTIDIDRIKKLQKLGEGKITVLPGIEFRSELGGSDAIHYIGIFSENSNIENIWLEIQVHCQLTSYNILQKGHDKINCDFKDTADLIHRLGGIVSVHAGGKSNTIENITNSWPDKMAMKTDLVINYVDIFEIGKVDDQIDYNTKVFPTIKHRLPMIICSDNHDIKKYSVKQNLWIKAEPTFEGLKQIKYEPELRVKIQEQNPNQKIPYEVIEQIRFITENSSDKNRFTSNKIKLNPDLNVIIGGKSSGKSLLLYSMANTIDPTQVAEKEKEENKQTDDKYNLRKSNIDFEVKWANNETKLFSNNNELSTGSYPLLYLPQSYIQKLADTEGKKTRKDVGKIIREILLQKEEYKNYYNSFITEVKRLDTIRENLISQYITARDIYTASNEKIKTIGNKDAITKFIDEKKEQIIELKKNSAVSIIEQLEYSDGREKLAKSNLELFELKNDREKLHLFNYSLEKLTTEIFNLKKQLLNELKNVEVKKNLDADLVKLDDVIEIPSKIKIGYTDQPNGLIGQIENIVNNRKKTVEDALAPISLKFTHREEIDEIEKVILSEHDKLNNIKKYDEEVNFNRQHKDDIKLSLLKEYGRTYEQYVDIVSKLNQGSKDISNLILTGSCKFYTKRFYERFRDIIHNNSTSESLYINPNFPANHNIDNVDDLESMINWLSNLFDRIVDGEIVLKSRFSIRDALNALFQDDFFDYWEVKSNNDEIAAMSPGKASLVLLKLLIDLSDSKCPILIDQPEDNLDNRSIYTDLVQYIRAKKIARQFIIVTHNPNILVGSDTENIIVANQNDQDTERTNETYQFDYTNGALENTKKKDDTDKNILSSMGIREHVTDLLEGGKEAFLKRESKYGYK